MRLRLRSLLRNKREENSSLSVTKLVNSVNTIRDKDKEATNNREKENRTTDITDHNSPMCHVPCAFTLRLRIGWE